MASSSTNPLPATIGAPPAIKLTRDNFLSWQTQALPTLRGARVMGLLDGSDCCPAEFLDAEDSEKKPMKGPNPAYDTWVMRDQQVVSYLVNSLAEDVLPHVFGLSIAATVWRALNNLYAAQSKSRVSTIRGALTNTKKLDMTVQQYITKMKGYASELAATGKPVDDDELKDYIMNGLDGSFNSLVAAINDVPSTSLNDMCSQILSCETHDQMLQTSGQAAPTSFMSSVNVVARQPNPYGGGFSRPPQPAYAPPQHPAYAPPPPVYAPPPQPAYVPSPPSPYAPPYMQQPYMHPYAPYQQPMPYNPPIFPHPPVNRHIRPPQQSPRQDQQRPQGRRQKGGKKDRVASPWQEGVLCQICKMEGHSAPNCWWRYGDDDEDDTSKEQKGAYGIDTNWILLLSLPRKLLQILDTMVKSVVKTAHAIIVQNRTKKQRQSTLIPRLILCQNPPQIGPLMLPRPTVLVRTNGLVTRRLRAVDAAPVPLACRLHALSGDIIIAWSRRAVPPARVACSPPTGAGHVTLSCCFLHAGNRASCGQPCAID
ncbi:hypothetical protein QYE76_003359 [Lolium multiflorum]|uniref:Retrotransposon Copia-like N-terminal domain-containing protein n=1 Tax=Lolium multiflorum TaxID=4521 RepID=A0AAD8W0E3_LOLMU|nr:hypothetical protein QYE76_003359 [Lolium multiflorum]